MNNTRLLIAIVIICVLVIAFVMYRAAKKRDVGPPPDCSTFGPGAKQLCQMGVAACSQLAGRDRAACEAAVGVCVPVAQTRQKHAHAWKTGKLSGAAAVNAFNEMAGHVVSCANAAMEVSPEGAAKLLQGKVTVPKYIVPFFQSPAARQNAVALSQLVPKGVNWGMSFGQDLSGSDNFTGAYHRADCHADTGCGPSDCLMA